MLRRGRRREKRDDTSEHRYTHKLRRDIFTMDEQKRLMLYALVPVAWADGVFCDRERELIEGLIDMFGATPGEAEEVREYANTARTVDDVVVFGLDEVHRRILLECAVFLSYADDDPSELEIKLIDAMVEKLGIPVEEAAEVREMASARARRFIDSLSRPDQPVDTFCCGDA